MVKFAFDKYIGNKPVPNLAVWKAQPFTAQWRLFSTHWPFSEPVHFLDYLDDEQIPYDLVSESQADCFCVYPISLSFFDYTINWKQLIPKWVFEKKLLIWFYYSEGDNPYKIKDHLDTQLGNCYHFTSANTAADHIENFSYFADDELLYRLRNQHCDPVQFHSKYRSKQFTCLSRTHKLWRATTMARLWKNNLHKVGYFSYNNDLDLEETYHSNPISFASLKGFPLALMKFLKACPFTADTLDSNQHNDHSLTVTEHYDNSYLNLVLETHLDTDGSGGAFLTEKIFKPIKNSQLFICIGAKGSIQKLRDLGYKTFDTLIDHSYDAESDNTLRWQMAMQQAELLINNKDLHKIYTSAQPELIHNQNLFCASKADRLNTLLGKIK